MTNERCLQILLVTLCLIGAVFVALSSEESAAIPLLVILGGSCAVLLTDVYQLFVLHRVIANILAISAVVFSLWNFFSSPSDSQSLAIGNLLVYLQLILFFQEKNERLYWQIILLSLLQVVVGAALNLGLVFGVLLFVYTILSLLAMVFFFLHREAENAELARNVTDAVVAWRSWLGTSPRAYGSTRASDFLVSSLTLRVLGHGCWITLAAICFSAVFFFHGPRHALSDWSPLRGVRSVQSGFSRNLELQQMGEMLQNNASVMKVWLENSAHQPLGRFEPYLYGEILPNYDLNSNAWTVSQLHEEVEREGVKPTQAPENCSWMRVVLEPTTQSALFSIVPNYIPADAAYRKEIRMDRASRLFFRRIDPSIPFATEFRYTVGTTGIINNFQPSITPSRQPNSWLGISSLGDEIAECLEKFPAERFPGLSRVAEEVLANRTTEERDPLLMARMLVEYFHTPGLYKYSLNMNIKRDPNLDPIEDFVVNHRTGHCQYFSSALIMMLRSQNIPARMVVGYRAHEFNEVGKFYQVRQRDAHAWVEAYIPWEYVPENELTGGPVGSTGAWIRLDPTPSSEEQRAALARTWLGTARDWLDYFDVVWSNYVVGLESIPAKTK